MSLAKVAFNERSMTETATIFLVQYNDLMGELKTGSFRRDKQYKRFRWFLESRPEAGFIASLYSCRYAPPGTILYEWGVETVKKEIASAFREGDLADAERHAAFAVSCVQHHPELKLVVERQIAASRALRPR